MIRIFKYPLEIADAQLVSMPWDAEILSVQLQGEQVSMWALVNDEHMNADRTFRIFGTGHEFLLTGRYRYLGTVQQFDGALVWHVFEEIR
jgi:hypothetical protein